MLSLTGTNLMSRLLSSRYILARHVARTALVTASSPIAVTTGAIPSLTRAAIAPATIAGLDALEAVN